MKRTAYGLALLALILPLAVHAKERTKVSRREPGTRWFSDLDAAIAEAKDRNIPLMVALHKDHWGGCIGMMESVFPSKDMRALSLEFAAVVCHGNTAHEESDYIVGGKMEHMCSWYDLKSCEVHEKLREEANKRGLLKNVRGTPTHIFYDPHTLTEISREHYLSTSKFEELVTAAQKKLGKPVTFREFAKLRKSLDEARAEFADGAFKKALRALNKFEPGKMQSLKLEAEELNAAIMATGQDLLAKAQTAVEGGEDKAAKKLLRSLAREFSGTDLEDEIKKLQEELKAKKD